MRGRSSSDAAGELWADPSTDAGSVIARVDNTARAEPGPASTVVVKDGKVVSAEASYNFANNGQSDLFDAIGEFQRRNRRFGAIDEE